VPAFAPGLSGASYLIKSMTAETTTSPDAPAQASGPLFYRQPLPLQSDKHANWRLRPGSLAFAAETNAIPAVIGEFGMAAQHFPILFTGSDATPIVAVGLARNNLFVTDGKWADNTYAPAYLRRYPFVFMQSDEDGNFLLALDADSEQVNQGVSDEGEPLFVDGKATELVDNAMKFCADFTREHEQTRQFSAALKAQDLLVERSIDVTLNGGEKMSVNGFQVVDVEKFEKLPDDIIVAWHRNGWLASIHHHLSSLARFNALVQRQSEQVAAAA
jgi:hypothetical protein